MILYLQEEDKYTEEELTDKLKSLNIKDINGFLISALSSRILIPYIEKIDYGSEIQELSTEYYKLKFVGILKIESAFIVLYPKYVENIQSDIIHSNKKFKEIIKVIEKYYANQIYESNFEKSESSSRFNLQIKILKEFMEYGIYSNEIESLKLNGDGEIVWEDTISKLDPIINNGKPIYLDFYTHSTRDEIENIARKIHVAILFEIQEELGLIIDLLGFEKNLFESEGINSIGDIDYLINELEKELRIQNVTLKQNILKNLIQYLNKLEESSSILTFEMHGTNSFNLVWEQICKKVYCDNLNSKLVDLNLNLKGKVKLQNSDVSVDYTDRKFLKDIVDKPIWTSLRDDLDISASSGALLDVLHINYQNQSFDIYDGKYYEINFKKDSISGQPGVEDINKQYFYQLAYKKLAMLNNFNFNNYFVVPVDDLVDDKGNGVEIFKARIPYVSELNLEDIVVIGRDCSTFYKSYLK
ncbi:LlaJI family restriction endonuclease [Streptococcus uberis]